MGVLKELFNYGGKSKNGILLDGVKLERKQRPEVEALAKEFVGADLDEDSDGASLSLGHDVENPKLQQLFNKASAAAQRLSTSAKRDLEKAFASKHAGERLARVKEFLIIYRNQLVNLLGTTQLAALLEGMRQVAADMPPVPPVGGPAPPPSLAPEEARDLVKTLAELPPMVRAQRIYELPVEQQAYVRVASSSGGAKWTLPELPTAHAGAVHFPKLEEAVKELAGKNVLPAKDYYRLDDAARQKAFTVARVAESETLEKIKDALAEQVSVGADVPEARARLIEAVGEGTFLSRPHLDTVIRNGIQGAFSDGQFNLLKNPGVRRGFPFCAIVPIDDDRVRPNHLAMRHMGLSGTGIFRVDDPVFQLFRAPWEWACRCNNRLMSVRRAAEAGVEHAKEWLRTGVEPPPEFVPMPPFRPDPTFRRQGVPLSIRLSMEPIDLEPKEVDAASMSAEVESPESPEEGPQANNGQTGGEDVSGCNNTTSNNDVDENSDNPILAHVAGRNVELTPAELEEHQRNRAWVEANEAALRGEDADWQLVDPVLRKYLEAEGGVSLSWTPYHGTGGGEGWKSSATGEVRYQKEKPTERGEVAPEQPSPVEKPNEQKVEMPGATITVEPSNRSQNREGSPDEHIERRMIGVADWAAKNSLDTKAIRGEIEQATGELLAARAANPSAYSPADTEDVVDHVANQVLSRHYEAARMANRERELAEFTAMKAEHLAKEIPNPPDLPKSAARVQVVSRRPLEKVQALVDKIFGKPTDMSSLAALVGAPDNARVSVTPSRDANKITIRVQHKDYTAKRTVGLDYRDHLHIHNDEFFMRPGAQRKGFGAEVFAKQVQAAKDAGVKYIDTHGAGGKGMSMNGYYTWPRFGYDQKIDYLAPEYHRRPGGGMDDGKEMKAKLKERFPHAETLSDVMLTKEGRDWWKENGHGITNMEFDLTPGSRSLRILYSYLQERQAAPKRLGIAFALSKEDESEWGDGYEHIDINQEDESALDRAWKRLEQEDMEPNGEVSLSSVYHGPQAPGPDWKLVGQGPQGGKIWQHEQTQAQQKPGLLGRLFGKKQEPQKTEMPGATVTVEPTVPKEVAPQKTVQERIQESKAYKDFTGALDKENEPIYEALASANKMTVPALKEYVANQAQKIVNSCDVYMRIPGNEVLGKILQGGRFKNQFETGTSMGANAPKLRKAIEAKAVGVSEDTHAASRPMYGYLSAKDFALPEAGKREPTSGYGDIIVKFKPRVRERATVTFGDSLSLGTLKEGHATPMTAVGHRSVSANDLHYQGVDMIDSFGDFNDKRQTYIEAQIHDGLSVDDVEEIRFPGEPPKDLQDTMQTAGIKWDTYGSKK